MRFTDQEKEQFHHDGFLIARQLFSKEETSLLIDATKGDESFNEQRHARFGAAQAGITEFHCFFTANRYLFR